MENRVFSLLIFDDLLISEYYDNDKNIFSKPLSNEYTSTL